MNVALLKDVENIPKMHRHTIGNKIIDAGLNAIHLLQAVYDASMPIIRMHRMEAFCTELATLSTYLRIANETKLIPLKRATDLFVQLDNIKKQLAGWKKATKGKI